MLDGRFFGSSDHWSARPSSWSLGRLSIALHPQPVGRSLDWLLARWFGPLVTFLFKPLKPRLVSWSVPRLVGTLVGQFIGLSLGHLPDWSLSWSIGWLVPRFIFPPVG